jgi:hypothetical protein
VKFGRFWGASPCLDEDHERDLDEMMLVQGVAECGYIRPEPCGLSYPSGRAHETRKWAGPGLKPEEPKPAAPLLRQEFYEPARYTPEGLRRYGVSVFWMPPELRDGRYFWLLVPVTIVGGEPRRVGYFEDPVGATFSLPADTTTADMHRALRREAEAMRNEPMVITSERVRLSIRLKEFH